jgi:chromosome partitioning protein
MRKILVASSKGGCGKTTIATHLAAHFADTKKNTALVDYDRQRSSWPWCQKRPEGQKPVLGIEGTWRWHQQLPADTEWVIVDTAAGITPAELEPLLEHVDTMVVPVLPSVIDLEATAAFLREIKGLARLKRGKVPIGLVANRMKPWTNASQEGLETMKTFGPPVVAQVRDTQGYALTTGLGKAMFAGCAGFSARGLCGSGLQPLPHSIQLEWQRHLL